MYRLPGYYEASPGVSLVDWAETLNGVKLQNTTWDAQVKEFFRDINPNMKRKARFVAPQDIAICRTKEAGPGSKRQRAFAHLMMRWYHHVGWHKNYPALIRYARTPQITIDECVDAMIAKEISFPSLQDINGDPTMEDIFPVFLDFVRHILSVQRQRAAYVERIRAGVSNIGFKIAKGVEIDQFERSLFLAYKDVSSPMGASKYAPQTKPIALVENDSDLVRDCLSKLAAVVENGPFVRFGRLVSNTNLHELFGAYGPFTPTLSFHTAYTTPMGPFTNLHPDSEVTVKWNSDLQQDAMRMGMRVHALSGASMIRSWPQIIIEPQRLPVVNDESANYWPEFDMPFVKLRMPDGFRSPAHAVEMSWDSPTMGRIVSTGRGADAMLLLKDIALRNKEYGGGATGELSLARWSLVDEKDLAEHVNNNAIKKYVMHTNFKERIMYRTPANEITTALVDLKAYYARKGLLSLYPAFTEYVALHPDMLDEPDEDIEQEIYYQLGLTRSSMLASQAMVRATHNYWKIKRMFQATIMPFPRLLEELMLRYGRFESDEVQLQIENLKLSQDPEALIT